MSDNPTSEDLYDVEAALVSCMVFNPSNAISLKKEITEFDDKLFIHKDWRLAFSIIKDLVAKNITPTLPVVGNALKEQEGENSATLHKIIEACSSPSCTSMPHAAYHETFKIIKERGTRALLANKLSYYADCARVPGTDLDEILSKTQRTIMDVNLSEDKSRTKAVANIAVEAIQEIHNNALDQSKTPGLMTGFPKLDEVTRGLRPGTMNLIAARPGVGKTAFALNIMSNVALNLKEDKPVLFFSVEMSSKDIVLRMLSSCAQLSVAQLESGQVPSEKWSQIVRYVKDLAPVSTSENKNEDRKHRMLINDQSGIKASSIWAEASKVAQEHDGLSLIVVDYVQIVAPERVGNININQQIKETNNILSCMAKELQCPLIMLSQLNRDIDRRSSKKPTNADLRDSGALEADADLIMFLTREEEAMVPIVGGDRVIADRVTLSITKNRRGALAEIPMSFYGAWCKFSEQ